MIVLQSTLHQIVLYAERGLHFNACFSVVCFSCSRNFYDSFNSYR